MALTYEEYLKSICSPVEVNQILKRRADYDPQVISAYETENDVLPPEPVVGDDSNDSNGETKGD